MGQNLTENEINEIENEISGLKSEVTRLRDALSCYANESFWTSWECSKPGCCGQGSKSNVGFGNRAREALARG